MGLSNWAGKKAPAELLIDVAALERAYFEKSPEVGDPLQMVSFGTSGHRGSPLDGTFTEAHILAIAQAICEYRAKAGIDGPMFVGKDTHGASNAAQRTAVEVFAANGVEVVVQEGDGYTPTPVISHAILGHNKGKMTGSRLADGVVITPSHNPPRDGGIKYNPTHGGPADVDVTGWVQDRANELLRAGNKGVKRWTYDRALAAAKKHDYVRPFVEDLPAVVDIEAIRKAGFAIGADPLGGASVAYWEAIRDIHKLNIDVVNTRVDATFGFMTVDHDGKIRMDCSSPQAMASLVELKNKYRVAFGNDPDSDRHGIVTPGAGLLNPNHYLAVAIGYLFAHRPGWGAGAGVGKTLVSSSIIDRVAAALGRKLVEVPVGFKWFVDGLFSGSLGFGGEESAGASFLRKDGRVWSTDKDGIILNLLAAEITAVTGRDPGEHFAELAKRFGTPYYTRVDQPATVAQKNVLKKLSPEAVKDTTLAGEAITAKLTAAPGNGAAIGGLKVTTANGWFAARPSGTENIYKIYAESLKSEAHLDAILQEARGIVTRALGA